VLWLVDLVVVNWFEHWCFSCRNTSWWGWISGLVVGCSHGLAWIIGTREVAR